MFESPVFRRCHFSSLALERGSLTAPLKSAIRRLHEQVFEDLDRELCVTTCSELLIPSRGGLPNWIGPDCQFLIFMDLPEPAAMRLPSTLNIRKPESRVHLTRDAAAVKRMAIALLRTEPWEGIVDAYVLGDQLVTVLGDLTIREFPRKQLPKLCDLSPQALASFEIDSSGSYMYWPELDVHLGPSQLLQAVDPMYLADVEIGRYARDKTSLVLLDLREEHSLTQAEIGGLSERQVRRLEKEESRLTVDASRKYAKALNLSLDEFLRVLASRISELRDPTDDRGVAETHDKPDDAYVA